MPAATAFSPTYGADYHGASRWSAKGVVGIVAAHAGILGFLASLDVVPLPAPLAALMVQIIAPAPAAAPDIITPPRPQPVVRKPISRPVPRPQPHTLAVQTEAPSAALDVVEKAQAVEPAPAVEPSPPAPTPAAVAPSVAAVTQARFDADYLQNPAPAYPPLSRRMGEEGKVVLRVFVEASGRPSQIEVKTGSGSARLDQAAQDAVWRWKFVSARRGSDAIGAWVLVPIVFNLRG